MRAAPFLLASLSIAGCAGLSQHRPDGSLDRIPLAEVPRTRLGGQVPHLPEAVRERFPSQVLTGTYRVCLDVRSGRVRDVRPLSGIPGADETIAAALRTWTWLVEVPQAGAPATLCFAEGLQFAVEGQSRFVSGPFADAEIRRQKLAGTLPHLPEFVRRRHRGETLTASYRVCVDAGSGRIAEVRPLAGLPEADTAIAFALSSWSWLFQVPAPLAGNLCFREDLRFAIPSAPSADAVAEFIPAPAIEFRADAAPLPRSYVFRKSLVRGEWPRLPAAFQRRYAGLVINGTYKLCADGRTGRVSTIRPVAGIPEADPAIVPALQSWRYEVTWPSVVTEICFTEQLRFPIDRNPSEDGLLPRDRDFGRRIALSSL